MFINYCIVILSVLALPSWCLEYLWSTKIDADPSWGVYQIQPLSCNVTLDGCVRMIVTYNSNPTYVYNANSNDIAATLTLGQGQTSAGALLSFAPNGTLIKAYMVDFVPSIYSYYYWTEDLVYLIGGYMNYGKTIRLNVETGDIMSFPTFLSGALIGCLYKVTVRNGNAYYLVAYPNSVGLTYLDTSNNPAWGFYVVGGNIAGIIGPDVLSSKSDVLLFSINYLGNRAPLKDKSGSQVSVLANYGSHDTFLSLVSTNGTFLWSVTGPFLTGEVQDDGSVYVVRTTASNNSLTVNLNQ